MLLSSEPYGEGSFFFRTLKTVVTEDQFARYEKEEREKRRYRYRAKVELAVAVLDQAVGFSFEQRPEARRAARGRDRTPRRFGQYDYQVVMLRAAQLPEEKLKPLFDDVQWQLLGRRFAQAKAMEPFLRQNGFVGDGAAAPAPFGVRPLQLMPAPAPVQAAPVAPLRLR